jgi:hypothetical protein
MRRGEERCNELSRVVVSLAAGGYRFGGGIFGGDAEDQ